MQRVVNELLDDLGSDGLSATAALRPVSLSSDLESDLGLDSLDRVELMARVEEAFGVLLPDSVLERARTPASVLEAVVRARGDSMVYRAPRNGDAQPFAQPSAQPFAQPAPPAQAAQPTPEGATARRLTIHVAKESTSGLSSAKPVPGEVSNLVDALAWHARVHPDQRHLRLCHLDGTPPDAEPHDVTYGDLHAGSLTVAESLRSAGLAPGERVAIMLPTVRAFFPLFAGILAAGGVAVPIYPPSRPDRIEEHLIRQVGILNNAGVSMMVTTGQGRSLSPILRLHVPTLRTTLDVDDLVAGSGARRSAGSGSGSSARRSAGSGSGSGARRSAGSGSGSALVPTIEPDSLAMLQYTSGSTGSPKGVMMTHRQLLANLHAMDEGAGPVPDDRFVSWLPLYHDMGLIGAWMAAMYLGFGSVIMSPLAFLSRPARWLTTIARESGTISAAPNFAFDLCVQRISDEDLRGVDLSSWRIVMSGAEPVRAATIDRFVKRFGQYGLRPEAIAPVYGMAEVGLGLTFTPPGRGPLVDTIDMDELAASGRAVPLPAGSTDHVRQVVSCGRPLPGFSVRIVGAGEDAGELPERSEGRIECQGPSTTAGYFHNPEATADLYRQQWLDTGDLGYLAGGELFLTGRSKDLVIKAGRNIHPEEIETAVGAVAGIRTGCVAAFAVTGTDSDGGTEQLVVVAETRVTDASGLEDLRGAVVAAVVEAIGSPPDHVVLAPSGSVLKTSSGKIRRGDTRASYEAGHIIEGITRASKPLAAQVLSLVARGLSLRARRTRRRWNEVAWGVRAWVMVLAIGVPTWFAVLVTPGRQRRWRIVQRAGMVLCSAIGVRLEVCLTESAGGPDPQAPSTGRTVPVPDGAVVVANHASFVDSLALLLALDGPVTFAAGEVLEAQRVAGPFLRRIGVVFVGGGDTRRAAAAIGTLTEAVRAGRTVVFFPEGGLAPAPGIRRFHRGGFLVAVGAGAPVVPVAIKGTREVVGPGHRFPRRGTVQVIVGPHLDAPVPGVGRLAPTERWSRAAELQGRARRWIIGRAGEPDAVTGQAAEQAA